MNYNKNKGVDYMSNLAFNNENIDYELLDGEIVYMTPRPVPNHNTVIVNLSTTFNNYLKGKKCKVFSDGVDVYLDEKNNIIPDLMIICNRDIIKSNGVYGAPDFIVEVLSPGTATKDKGYKKDLYEKFGVKEYWIVDIPSKSIDVYLLKNDKYVLDYVYLIYPDYILEKMTDDEKLKVITKFKMSLFDDLIIDLDDVFCDVE